MLSNVIFKHIIDCRDYFYFRLKSAYEEEIAKKDVTNLMVILFSQYYASLIIFIGMLQYKSRIPVPEYLKNNLAVAVIGGAILLYPLYFLNRFVINKLSVIPINETMTTKKLKATGIKVVVIYVCGFFLAFLVGWSMQELVPFFR